MEINGFAYGQACTGNLPGVYRLRTDDKIKNHRNEIKV